MSVTGPLLKGKRVKAYLRRLAAYYSPALDFFNARCQTDQHRGKEPPMTDTQSAPTIRAPRGTGSTCKGWHQEAALRMLMNNLDPEVAERPEDLVVYGGTGKAARDWESFWAIVSARCKVSTTTRPCSCSRANPSRSSAPTPGLRAS